MRKSFFIILFSLICFSTGAQKESSTSLALEHQGYVNVHSEDPTIFVSLMYSRADNFTGRVLYDDLKEAYLYPTAAKALLKAQRYLKKIRPDLSLKIYDAARPMRIQRKMWRVVAGTPKYKYVSNPAHGGGLHNYGLAVDITLCNLHGDSIAMGTKIDYMGSAAHIDNERALVNQHKISEKVRKNRELLRRVMIYAGFKPLRTEWWHFNYKSRPIARKYYKVIQ
jgi:D-alanyl-D-alanine dipeptidase